MCVCVNQVFDYDCAPVCTFVENCNLNVNISQQGNSDNHHQRRWWRSDWSSVCKRTQSLIQTTFGCDGLSNIEEKVWRCCTRLLITRFCRVCVSVCVCVWSMFVSLKSSMCVCVSWCRNIWTKWRLSFIVRTSSVSRSRFAFFVKWNQNQNQNQNQTIETKCVTRWLLQTGIERPQSNPSIVERRGEKILPRLSCKKPTPIVSLLLLLLLWVIESID
jgi:hypothetical protein